MHDAEKLNSFPKHSLYLLDQVTNIKSIAFETGRPFGLKEDGSVVSVEDNKTTVYKDFTDPNSFAHEVQKMNDQK